MVDSRDVLEDPAGTLGRLCSALGLAFTEDMLRWPPGPRETDGVWAQHWYGSVTNSRGFSPWQPRDVVLPDSVADLVEPCEALYRRLHDERITGPSAS